MKQCLLEGSEFEVNSHAVLKLVKDSDCSAYDCEFVARNTAQHQTYDDGQ